LSLIRVAAQKSDMKTGASKITIRTITGTKIAEKLNNLVMDVFFL
jgi:hypothetical protein